MTPSKFEHSNLTWKGYGENVQDLHVYCDGSRSLSMWKADSFWARVRFLFSGRMWLWVYHWSDPMSPVMMESHVTFRNESEEEYDQREARRLAAWS